jgi:hypothetical protein
MPVNDISALEDYAGSGFFSFDRATGNAQETAGSPRVQGFGQWRTFGLWRARERTFIAVIVDGNEIVMSVAGRDYCLTEPDVVASISRRALGAARDFRLSHRGQIVFTATYWFFFGAGGWPDDGDIFSLVQRVANAKDGGRGFVRVWQARSKGRRLDSREFLEQL